jgi:hypothetical protein
LVQENEPDPNAIKLSRMFFALQGFA